MYSAFEHHYAIFLSAEMTVLHVDRNGTRRWRPVPDTVNFRVQDVAILLDQAADFLDRGLRDRDAFANLSESAFRLAQEYREFASRLEVLENEVAAREKLVSKARNDVQAIIQKIENVQGLVNTLASMDTGYFNPGNRQLARDAAGQRWGGPFTKATTFEIDWEFEYRRSQLIVATSSASVELAPLQSTKLGLEANVASEDFNLAALRARLNGTRLQAQRFEEACREGSQLNVIERMGPLQTRFENDFDQAFDRIQVAAIGMREVLDCRINSILELPDPETLGYGFFDACVVWVRNAISWIVTQSRHEELIIYSLSLKNLLGPQWPAAKTASRFVFDLDRAILGAAGSLSLLRMRGISLSTIPDQASGSSDSLGASVSVEPDENIDGVPAITRCEVGRVLRWESARLPELIGLTALYNISPIGEWTINLRGGDSGNLNYADLRFDVHCIGRLNRA